MESQLLPQLRKDRTCSLQGLSLAYLSLSALCFHCSISQTSCFHHLLGVEEMEVAAQVAQRWSLGRLDLVLAHSPASDCSAGSGMSLGRCRQGYQD